MGVLDATRLSCGPSTVQEDGRLGDWYSTACMLTLPLEGQTTEVTGVVDVPTSAATVAPTTLVVHTLPGDTAVPGVHDSVAVLQASPTALCLMAHCSVEKPHLGRR
jgi:hypothetical protein